MAKENVNQSSYQKKHAPVVSLQTEKVDVSGFQQLLVDHHSQSQLHQSVQQVSNQMDMETVLQ